MKKLVFILSLLFFVSCKEEAVEKPEHLIEKGVMVDIMYDISLLNAIKYQKPASLEGYDTSELKYIYTKYKIDSTQLVQNNNYYTANYKEYKKMFDQVTNRINNNRTKLDTIISQEDKERNVLANKLKPTTLDTLNKKKSIKEKLKQGAKEKGEGVLD